MLRRPLGYGLEYAESSGEIWAAMGHWRFGGSDTEMSVDQRLGDNTEDSGEVRIGPEGIVTVARKTICQAISEVLGASGQPMTSREICETIAQQGLYNFKAKDPLNVVRGQLRRHCVNVPKRGKAGVARFRLTDDSRFELLQSPDGPRSGPDTERVDVFVPSWEGGATKSGFKVGDYVIWPHPHTKGIWLARKGGPTVPGKLGRFTSAEKAISWAYQQIGLRKKPGCQQPE